MSFFLSGIPIPDTQDIGDSLVYINRAFLDLDTKVALLCAGGRNFATLASHIIVTDGSFVYFLPTYINDIPDNYIVYLDGVKQLPNIDYTINAEISAIQFPDPPPSPGITLEVIRAVAIASFTEDATKLPLAGGTITGNLSGTSAGFTGPVNASSFRGDVHGSIELGPTGTISQDGFIIFQNYTAQLTGLNIVYGGQVTAIGNTIDNSYGSTITENLSFANGSYVLDSTGLVNARAATFTNDVSALAFFGDGSKLTGVTGGTVNALPLSGGTLTGALSGTTAIFNSVSAIALSGTFFGDGSKLTGIASGGTANALPLSGGTLTGALSGTTATFTSVAAGSLSGTTATFTSVAAGSLSGTFFGDGSKLTGLTGLVTTEVQMTTAGQTLFTLTTASYVPNTNAIAVYFNGFRLISNRDYIETSNTTVTLTQSATVGNYLLFEIGKITTTSLSSVDPSKLPLAGGTLTGALIGQTAVFNTSVLAPALSGTFFGDGRKLTGVLGTDSTKLALSGGTLTGPLIGQTGTFSTSISAPTLSGTHFGDGSRLTGVVGIDNTKLPLTGGTLTGNLIGGRATFTTFVSAPALSGSFFGDGSRLTGIIGSGGGGTANALPLSGGTLTGGLSGISIHLSDGLVGTAATFTTSVSAPIVRGTFFGNGTNLTGVLATDVTKLPLGGGTLTGALNGTTATFTASISAPIVSGSHTGDGSRLTGVNDSTKLHLSGGTLTGALNGSVATFSTSVSTNSIFGDGRNLSFVPLTNTSLANTQLSSFVSGGVDYYTYSLIKPKYGNNLIDIGYYSSILGGNSNAISGGGSNGLFGPAGPGDPWYFNFKSSYSSIIGGFNNKIIQGSFSAIVGGQNNYIAKNNSFTIGSNLTATSDNTTYVNNLNVGGNLTIQGQVQGATTFSTSVSSPSLSGTMYGDGSKLKNVAASLVSEPVSNVYGVSSKTAVLGLAYNTTGKVFDSTGNYNKADWKFLPTTLNEFYNQSSETTYANTDLKIRDIRKIKGNICIFTTLPYDSTSVYPDAKTFEAYSGLSDNAVNLNVEDSTVRFTFPDRMGYLPEAGIIVHQDTSGALFRTEGSLTSTKFNRDNQKVSIKYFSDLGLTYMPSGKRGTVSVPKFATFNNSISNLVPRPSSRICVTRVYNNQWYLFTSKDGVKWTMNPLKFQVYRTGVNTNPGVYELLSLSGVGISDIEPDGYDPSIGLFGAGLNGIEIQWVVSEDADYTGVPDYVTPPTGGFYLVGKLDHSYRGYIAPADPASLYALVSPDPYFVPNTYMIRSNFIAGESVFENQSTITFTFRQNVGNTFSRYFDGQGNQLGRGDICTYPINKDVTLVGYDTLEYSIPVGYNTGTLSYADSDHNYTVIENLYQMGGIRGIDYSEKDNLFLASGATGLLHSSEDGITWETKGVPNQGAPFTNIVANSGAYVGIVGANSTASYSQDKQKWTPITVLPSGIKDVLCLEEVNTFFAYTSAQLYTSSDGVTWNILTNNIPATINNVTITDTNVFVCGAAGQMGLGRWTKSIGLGDVVTYTNTWVSCTTPITGNVYHATTGGTAGNFVAVGENSGVAVFAYASTSLFNGTFTKADIKSSYITPTIDRVVSNNIGFLAFNSANISSGSNYSSPDGITWHEKSLPFGPSSTASRQLDIAYGNAVYLHTGSVISSNRYTSSYMNSSYTGSDWSPCPKPTYVGVNGSLPTVHLNFANNLFVAQNRAGGLCTSPSGSVWTSRMDTVLSGSTTSLTLDINVGLTTNGTNILAVANDKFSYSTNSTTWSTYIGPITAVGCTYDAVSNKFVVWDSTKISTSVDGTTWSTPVIHGTPMVLTGTYAQYSINTVAANNNIIVVAGGQSTSRPPIRYSTDGGTTFYSASTFDASTNSLSRYINDVKFAGDRFIAIDGNDTIHYSYNGSMWFNPQAFEEINFPHYVAYGNNIYVGFGGTSTSGTNASFYSVDGIGWARFSLTNAISSITSTNFYLHGVTYGAGKFVASGRFASGTLSSTAYVLYSTDGINWTPKAIGSTGVGKQKPIYANGRFLAHQHYSADGITWTAMSTSTSNGGNTGVIGYLNGTYFAFDQPVRSQGSIETHAKVKTSADGSTWTTQTLSFVPADSYGAMYEGRNLLNSASNAAGTVAIVALGSTRDSSGTYYGGGIVLRSTNGIAWTTVKTPLQKTIRNVAYGNGSFAVIDTSGAVSYSFDDGITWSVSSTSRLAGQNQYNKNIAFINDRFILIDGTYGGTTTSVNTYTSPQSYYGSTWTSYRSKPGDLSTFPNSLEYVNGKLFALNRGLWETSNQGTNWNSQVNSSTVPYFGTSVGALAPGYIGYKNIFISACGRVSFDGGKTWKHAGLLGKAYMLLAGKYLLMTGTTNIITTRTGSFAMFNLDEFNTNSPYESDSVPCTMYQEYTQSPLYLRQFKQKGEIGRFTQTTTDFSTLNTLSLSSVQTGAITWESASTDHIWVPTYDSSGYGAIAFIDNPFIDVGVSSSGITLTATPSQRPISYFDISDAPCAPTTNFDQEVTMFNNLNIATVTESIVSLTALSSMAIFLSNSSFFTLKMSTSITSLTFNGFSTTAKVRSFAIHTIGDGTARAIVWPTSVKWPSNIPPTITSTLGKADTMTFLSYNGGTSWYGFIVAQNQ